MIYNKDIKKVMKSRFCCVTLWKKITYYISQKRLYNHNIAQIMCQNISLDGNIINNILNYDNQRITLKYLGNGSLNPQFEHSSHFE